jgi:hypothetical protein
LLGIVLSCFDLLVRELQSDFTSPGTLRRGWLYLPEGVTRPRAHAVYGGLHAVDGLLILGIGGYLYARARQRES